MTLQEWCKKYDVRPCTPTTETGAVTFTLNLTNHPGRSELYRLNDHAVSSVCGVVVWMVPAIRTKDGHPWHKTPEGDHEAPGYVIVRQVYGGPYALYPTDSVSLPIAKGELDACKRAVQY
jgi:hypothetical protein